MPGDGGRPGDSVSTAGAVLGGAVAATASLMDTQVRWCGRTGLWVIGMADPADGGQPGPGEFDGDPELGAAGRSGSGADPTPRMDSRGYLRQYGNVSPSSKARQVGPGSRCSSTRGGVRVREIFRADEQILRDQST